MAFAEIKQKQKREQKKPNMLNIRLYLRYGRKMNYPVNPRPINILAKSENPCPRIVLVHISLIFCLLQSCQWAMAQRYKKSLIIRSISKIFSDMTTIYWETFTALSNKSGIFVPK